MWHDNWWIRKFINDMFNFGSYDMSYAPVLSYRHMTSYDNIWPYYQIHMPFSHGLFHTWQTKPPWLIALTYMFKSKECLPELSMALLRNTTCKMVIWPFFLQYDSFSMPINSHALSLAKMKHNVSSPIDRYYLP